LTLTQESSEMLMVESQTVVLASRALPTAALTLERI
jgi:hypothetical protein